MNSYSYFYCKIIDIIRLLSPISFFRCIGYRLFEPQVKLGRGVFLGTSVVLKSVGKRGGSFIRIGENVFIESNSRIETWGGNVSVGSDVFIGPQVIIYGHGGVTIGSQTMISMHSRILSSEHQIPRMGELIRSKADVLKATTIGSDVWIGAGVTVLGGVSIGDGAVVGAGSTVTRNVEGGAVVVGNPARVVRWRDK